MNNNLFLTLFIICFFAVFTEGIGAQEAEKDSITTPFRKGRWLASLAGSIGSSATENTTSEVKLISNYYRIEISAGKFVIDRLNIGLNVNLERESFHIEIDEERTSEDLFIGPKIAYFVSKSEIGSLYFSLTPGFIMYRDETEKGQNENFIDNVNKGNGFGLFSTFGYVYAIKDRVAFDLGLNWSSYWIDINQESIGVQKVNSVNFVLSDFTFSFGFKILLDSKLD